MMIVRMVGRTLFPDRVEKSSWPASGLAFWFFSIAIVATASGFGTCRSFHH